MKTLSKITTLGLLCMTALLHGQINKPGINLGYLGNYDTGVIPDNLACMMNCGFEPLDYRTNGLQFVDGTTTMAFYEPYYTNGGQPVLPANHLLGYTYTLNNSVGADQGCVAQVTASSPYPGIAATTIATAFSITNGSPTTVTFTAANSYAAGMVLVSYGATNTYLNNQVFTVTAATSSSITVTGAGFSHASVGTTTDSIGLTPYLAITVGSITCPGTGATVLSALPGITKAGDKYTLELLHSPTSAEWISGIGNITVKTSGAPVLTSDTTTPIDGAESLIVDTTPSGSGVTVSATFDNGVFAGATNLNRFVSLDGTYNASFVAKVKSGSASFTLGVYRGFGSAILNSDGSTRCSATFTATSAPQTFTVPTCTPTENASNPTPQFAAQLEFTPTGAGVIEIDDLTLNKTSGKNSVNTSPFRDDVVAALQYATGYGDGITIQPGATPTHQPAVWSTLRDWVNDQRSWAALSATAFHAPQNIQGNPGNEAALYAPQFDDFMQLAAMVGAVPYFTTPESFTDAEGVAMVEHTANSWVGTGKTFPFVFLPYGNENWNTAFQGDVIPPTRPTAYNGQSDYVDRAIELWRKMALDPAFDPNTFRLILNEQYGNVSGYTDTNAAAPIPLLVAAGVPLYGFETAKYWQPNLANFDTEADQWQAGLVEAWADGTNNAVWYPQPTGPIQGLVACGSGNTQHCNITVYEQANSTGATCGMNGTPACGTTHSQYITQAVLQQAQRGAGTALIAATQALGEMNAGYTATNLFGLSGYSTPPFISLTPGDNQYTNPAYNAVWGQTIDMGGATSYLNRALFGGHFTPSPSLIGLHLLNKTLLGANNACATGLPTFNFAGDTSNGPIPATSNVPLVEMNCTKDANGNVGVFIVNNDQAASHTVPIPSAYALVGSVTAELFAPSSLDLLNEAVLPAATNTTAAQVYTTTSTIVSPASYTLPPHSIVALTGSALQLMQITHQAYGGPVKYGSVQPY